MNGWAYKDVYEVQTKMNDMYVRVSDKWSFLVYEIN